MGQFFFFFFVSVLIQFLLRAFKNRATQGLSFFGSDPNFILLLLLLPFIIFFQISFLAKNIQAKYSCSYSRQVMKLIS